MHGSSLSKDHAIEIIDGSTNFLQDFKTEWLENLQWYEHEWAPLQKNGERTKNATRIHNTLIEDLLTSVRLVEPLYV